jgi:hypothetical protein
MWPFKKKTKTPSIKDSDHTGPEIKRGMCWTDIIHKSAVSFSEDGDSEKLDIPVSVFCVALAFNDEKWTLMYMDADELMVGRGEWCLMDYYHKNLPESDEIEVVDRINGCSIYNAFFCKESDSSAEASDE